MNMVPALVKAWVIFADLKNVDLICSEISAWLTEMKLSEHIFPLEMLTREALNNAIIHGCQMDANRNIYTELQCDENALRLTVADDGSGFDWWSFLQNNTVNEEKESGRGLKLCQLYADQIEFNECGNQVVLTRLLKNEKLFKSFQKKERRKINMQPEINEQIEQDPIVRFYKTEGDLTASTAPMIRVDLKNLIAEGVRELVIDMVNTRVIDSSGIGLLVATHNSLMRLNGKLTIKNVSQDLLELLKAFRLDKHFSISGDPKLG